jgi:hypothetical protein
LTSKNKTNFQKSMEWIKEGIKYYVTEFILCTVRYDTVRNCVIANTEEILVLLPI